MADVSKYLPKLLGPHSITVDSGDELTSRPTWDFAAPLSATDDSVNDTTRFTLVPATSSVAGSMSAADKAKLDGSQTQGSSVAIAALAIDWSAGGVFYKTLAAGANTLTFSNATDGWMITVILTGAASTVTWPTVLWPGGSVPTQTASGVDVYTFVKRGSAIYGSFVQAMA